MKSTKIAYDESLDIYDLLSNTISSESMEKSMYDLQKLSFPHVTEETVQEIEQYMTKWINDAGFSYDQLEDSFTIVIEKSKCKYRSDICIKEDSITSPSIRGNFFGQLFDIDIDEEEEEFFISFQTYNQWILPIGGGDADGFSSYSIATLSFEIKDYRRVEYWLHRSSDQGFEPATRILTELYRICGNMTIQEYLQKNYSNSSIKHEYHQVSDSPPPEPVPVPNMDIPSDDISDSSMDELAEQLKTGISEDFEVTLKKADSSPVKPKRTEVKIYPRLPSAEVMDISLHSDPIPHQPKPSESKQSTVVTEIPPKQADETSKDSLKHPETTVNKPIIQPTQPSEPTKPVEPSKTVPEPVKKQVEPSKPVAKVEEPPKVVVKPSVPTHKKEEPVKPTQQVQDAPKTVPQQAVDAPKPVKPATKVEEPINQPVVKPAEPVKAEEPAVKPHKPAEKQQPQVVEPPKPAAKVEEPVKHQQQVAEPPKPVTTPVVPAQKKEEPSRPVAEPVVKPTEPVKTEEPAVEPHKPAERQEQQVVASPQPSVPTHKKEEPAKPVEPVKDVIKPIKSTEDEVVPGPKTVTPSKISGQNREGTEAKAAETTSTSTYLIIGGLVITAIAVTSYFVLRNRRRRI